MDGIYRLLGGLRCPACGRFITAAFSRRVVRDGIATCCKAKVA